MQRDMGRSVTEMFERSENNQLGGEGREGNSERRKDKRAVVMSGHSFFATPLRRTSEERN